MSRLPTPPHLTDRSRELWEHLTSTYELDAEHRVVLLLGLEALDRGAQAREQLEREGLTLTGSHGGTVVHPAVAVERDSRTAVLRCFRQLGLDQYANG